MRVFAAFTFVAAVLVAAPAMAQIIRGQDRVVYEPVTVLEFGDDLVTSIHQRPAGEFVTGRPQAARFGSLIKVRASLQPELEASVAKL
jgi:hypothetical protein